MITLERASDLVSGLTGNAKIDLFDHFVAYFDLKEQAIIDFARLCNFTMAFNVKMEN